LIDKLGVKERHAAWRCWASTTGVRRSAQDADRDVYVGRRRIGLDQMFVLFDRREELVRLPHPQGLHREGRRDLGAVAQRLEGINENDVRDAALDVGLVDVKVVSFSPELSALKLIYRLRTADCPPAHARRGDWLLELGGLGEAPVDAPGPSSDRRVSAARGLLVRRGHRDQTHPGPAAKVRLVAFRRIRPSSGG
jgi:hypothetical protein